MSRRWRITLSIAGALGVLLLALVVTGVYLAQSDWLREKVRQRMISEAERSTGGKVEIGSFRFDWKTLTAEMDEFVIHGTEPAGGPPLLRIRKLVAGLKIISLVKQDFDIASLRIEAPQSYLLVSPDGSTNIPKPKMPVTSDKSAVETILDLKIGEFQLSEGQVEVHAAGQPPKIDFYDASGKNLKSRFVYESGTPRYQGFLSMEPLDLRYGKYKPVQVNVALALSLEKNRLQITSGKLDTADSHMELSCVIDNLTSPIVTARYNGDLSIRELGDILRLKSRQSGRVQMAGDARYASAKDYLVTGNLQAKDVAFAQTGLNLRNVRASSALRLDPKLLELNSLRVAAWGGTLTGRAELREFEAYQVEGKLQNFKATTLAALATKERLPYDGKLSGPFKLQGRISDPNNRQLVASARLSITPTGEGVPVQGLLDAKYEGARDLLTMAPSHVDLPSTSLKLSGALGQELKVQVRSSDLSDLTPLLKGRPLPIKLEQGSITFDGTVIGKLQSPRIDGHVDGRNFVYSGQLIDSLYADVTAQSTGAVVHNGNVAYRHVRANFEGSVGLRDWKPENFEPLTARLGLQNASIPELLSLVGQKNIPVSGTLTTTAQVGGTIGDPKATANLNVVNGSAYGEPFDRLTGKVDYTNSGTQTANLQMKAGARQIDLNATYQHAPGNFESGRLHFKLASNRMTVAQFATVRKYQPHLNGAVLLTANGDVAVTPTKPSPKQPSTVRIDIGRVDADLSATGIQYESRLMGDLRLTARTEGQTVKAHLESDLAHAVIKGDGTWQLTGNYPGNAQVTFAKLDPGALLKVFAPAQKGQQFSFIGDIDGRATLSGPLAEPDALRASLEIPHLEIKPDLKRVNQALGDIVVRNTEPLRVSLANSIVKVDSARFSARDTNLSITGAVNLKAKEQFDLNVNGRADLSLASVFNPDLTSSGSLQARVTLRGSFEHPELGGRADIKDGNFSMAGVPNGLSNANGRILFDQDRATIETLTAQTGGGTVKLDGFVAFSRATSFRLIATANQVRVRYPEGVSSVSDANITLTGTSDRSVVAGNITVQKVSYNTQTDLSSLLGVAGPSGAQATSTGFLGGMQFDVRIQTSPDITFQSGLVADLEVQADLRLRGTAANPALLGRILIDQGNLTFFGNKYVINEGTISFFNPVHIEPVLNVDLETRARGVDVTLTVSGPLNKLNVTYRSDPPLQFSDIVGLLATGKTPNDPTLAARQTDTQQSWQELGASALVGQALANPVAGRLQRFFGVSKLKIDPLLTGLGGVGSNSGGSRGARVSVEQQITPNIIFDYVVNTNSTSAQIVRLEWAFSRNWSAVAIREENSAFGIDFQFKKRFK